MFEATPIVQRKLGRERLARWVFSAMVLFGLVPLVTIVIYLLARALPALSWEFISEFPRRQGAEGGIFPAIVGTFCMVATSLVIATPIGILAAVYLNEYARDNWFNRLVNLAVVNLAGVPSIVHALFGVAAFVNFSYRGVGFPGRSCILAASLTLAIMTLPVVIASTKQALAAVPMAFREACWNMGASRWQTIRTIVLPNSISGILTGVILEVSRAAGETAPIMFTGALAFRGSLPRSPLDQTMTLSMHLYGSATQGAQVPESMQYGTAVVLLGLVLAFNAGSIFLRIYFRSRKRW